MPRRIKTLITKTANSEGRLCFQKKCRIKVHDIRVHLSSQVKVPLFLGYHYSIVQRYYHEMTNVFMTKVMTKKHLMTKSPYD
jgi:hypothetical protein